MVDEVKPVETPVEVKPVEVKVETPVIDVDKIKQDLQGEFEKKLAEQTKSIEESYLKKFQEMDKKLEDMAPRKGLVNVPASSPYQEIAKEKQAVDEPVAPVKMDPFAINKVDKATDYQIAQDFLGALRN